MTTARRRVAVAVQPALLGDTVTAVLADLGDIEVVNLRRVPDAGPFDVAVVTVDLAGVDAGVVIHLPEASTIGRVETAGRYEARPLAGVADLLAALDVVLPGWRGGSPTDAGREHDDAGH